MHSIQVPVFSWDMVKCQVLGVLSMFLQQGHRPQWCSLEINEKCLLVAIALAHRKSQTSPTLVFTRGSTIRPYIAGVTLSLMIVAANLLMSNPLQVYMVRISGNPFVLHFFTIDALIWAHKGPERGPTCTYGSLNIQRIRLKISRKSVINVPFDTLSAKIEPVT